MEVAAVAGAALIGRAAINALASMTLNRINREDLEPGDHIFSWRKSFVYAHHGIYVGEGMVIHFTTGDQHGPGNISSSAVSRSANNPCPICGYNSNRDGGVIHTCLDCFLSTGDLYRFEYGVSQSRFESLVRNQLDLIGPICTSATSDPPEDVLRRARYLLQKGFGPYHAVHNNCIHFAKYCKLGNRALGDSSVFSLPFGIIAQDISEQNQGK